jgi:beta-lactamase regulating signal transducer with metallopeptidase domain
MQTLLEYGLSNAIMATVMAFGAACAARMCRRPAVSHALWLLVLLKLVTPPLVKIPVAWPGSDDAVAPIACEATPKTVTPAEKTPPTQVAMSPGRDETQAAVLFMLLREARAQQERLQETVRATPGDEEGSTASRMWQPLISNLAIPFLVGFWVLGSMAWFGVALVRIRRFQKLLRLGKEAPESLQREVSFLAGQMMIRRVPVVWLVPGHISPLLWALGGQSRLVLPADLWQQLEPEQRSTLLAHELAHELRRDYWIRWLEFVSVGLYWWHPVAWWARHELQQAGEQCCDAWVVHTFPRSGKAYARALLQTVNFLDARPVMPPVASGAGHVQSLKRRLNMIVRTPLSPRAPWFFHAAIVVAGLVILPLSPLRLEARNLWAGQTRNDADDDRPADSRQDRVRDLEKRIRELEGRLDRILQKLETRSRIEKDGNGEEEMHRQQKMTQEQYRRSEEMMRQAQQRAEEQIRRAQEKAQEMARKAEERGREAARQAEGLVREARQRAEEQVKRAQEKVRELRKQPGPVIIGRPDGSGGAFEFKFNPDGKEEHKHIFKFETTDDGHPGEKKHHRIIIDGTALDSKTLEDLHKQIEQGIHDSINPERLKQMEKVIEDTVQKSIDPKRLAQLDREIERAVKQSINPQRLEALARQIESAVNRSLKDSERDKVREQREESPGTSRKKDREPLAGPSAKSTNQLEKRLDKLEKKMDKILKSLEEFD